MIGTKFYVMLLGFFILISKYRPEYDFGTFIVIMLMLTAIEITLTIFNAYDYLKWHRTCPKCGTKWKNTKGNKKY